MFSGLSNFLKDILPKRLFYRALLIVAVPVLVLQLVITVVFFDSLWIKTNKGMTRALINEINLFVEVYGNEKTNKDELKNLFSLFIDLNIELVKNKNLENRPALFLDRDGTIVRYEEYLHDPLKIKINNNICSLIRECNLINIPLSLIHI